MKKDVEPVLYIKKKKKPSFQESIDNLRAACVVIDVASYIVKHVEEAVEEDKKTKRGKMYRSYLYGDRR